MKVIITAAAQVDLANLIAWIGSDDMAAAIRFGDELVAKARQIGQMPHAFAVVARRRQADLRKRSHRNHAIIYRVTTEVEVLRIVDARRDYISLLDEL